MSISVFKGPIETGKISALFRADFSNESSELLTMSYAETGGANPQVEHAAVAPGGSATVSLDVKKEGIMEVWVVAGSEQDSGRLTISCAGAEVDDDATQGSVRWVYAVVTP